LKILIVHQYYILPGHSGGTRFNEFARHWAAAGHDVTVISGTRDHFTGEAPDVYHGRWITREMDGPVKVIRCYVPGSYGRGFSGRMWGFVGFTLSATTGALLAERPDVVISSSPPLIIAVPGYLATRLRRRKVPWVFEVRDLWPESAVTTGVLREGATLTRLLYRLERAAYRRSERINVLTPAFREDILRRDLAQEHKIVFVPNGADTDLFSPGDRDNDIRRELGWGQRFVVMYAGAHGRANALHQLVDAAEILRDRDDILIASVGEGPDREELVRDAQQRGLTNIQFTGPVAKRRMPEVVNACDVGAAVLQDNPTFRTVYPNKVFDYMACERPTLLAIDGGARDLVCDEAQAGVFVRPEDPQAIADAIIAMKDDPAGCREMGRRGREWVEANAARPALAERYLRIMSEMIGA
jgi:glycosyltransferase involved in cell wall biosynthesis